MGCNERLQGIGAHLLDLRMQAPLDFGEPRWDTELLSQFFFFVELKIRKNLGARYAALILAGRSQFDFCEIGKWDWLVMGQQLRSNHHGRPIAPEHGLRIDEKIGSQLVSFPEVVKRFKDGKAPVDQQHILELSRLFKRNQNPPALVGLKLAFTDLDAGRRHLLALGVDDPYQLTCIADCQDRRELAFLDQGSAALPPGEDLDDPNTLAVEFRQFDRFAMASVALLRIDQFAFDVGYNPVEVQCRRDGRLLLAEYVPRIDPIDPDEKLGSVFQIEGQADAFIGFKDRWVVWSKLDFDAFGKFLLGLGRELRIIRFGIAQPVKDFRRCEESLQVPPFEHVCKLVDARIGLKEQIEVLFDQGHVVADRSIDGWERKRSLDIDQRLLPHRIAKLYRTDRSRVGQSQVTLETIAVGCALFQVENQTLVEDCGDQAIVNFRERDGIRFGLFKLPFSNCGVLERFIIRREQVSESL